MTQPLTDGANPSLREEGDVGIRAKDSGQLRGHRKLRAGLASKESQTIPDLDDWPLHVCVRLGDLQVKSRYTVPAADSPHFQSLAVGQEGHERTVGMSGTVV